MKIIWKMFLYLLWIVFIFWAISDIQIAVNRNLIFLIFWFSGFIILGVLILPISYCFIKKYVFQYKMLWINFKKYYTVFLIWLYILLAVIFPLIPSYKEQLRLLEIERTRGTVVDCMTEKFMGDIDDWNIKAFDEYTDNLGLDCLENRIK